jgi:hypothetical protein
MRASPKDGFDERSEMGHPKDDRAAMRRSLTNPAFSAIFMDICLDLLILTGKS